jgi:hypothetical protein
LSAEISRQADALATRVRDAEEQVAELARRLLDAETAAAHVTELELQIRELEQRLRQEREAAAGEKAAADQRRQELEDGVARLHAAIAGLESSLSWRLTRPLRALKRGFSR